MRRLFTPRNRVVNRMFVYQPVWLVLLIVAVLYITWTYNISLDSLLQR